MADQPIQRAGSPSRVAGMETRDFTYQGVVYHLTQPLKLKSYGEQENLILSRRQDPMIFAQRAAMTLPPHMHASLWEGCSAAASRGVPSKEEWASYEDSLWRQAYRFWSTLDPQQKGRRTLLEGVAWAVEFLNEMDLVSYRELMTLVTIVSQERALGNSDGPTDGRAESDSPKTDTPSTTAGP